MDGRNLGSFGEERAVRWLLWRGYRVLERNYRRRQGEIDIIARRGRFLCFIEVKLRKDASHGEAREFVTWRKQQRIKTAAMLWLGEHETQLQPRFDVLEIYAPQGEKGPVRIELIENAFM